MNFYKQSYRLLTILCLLLVEQVTFAQFNAQGEPIIRCHAVEADAQLRAKYPKLGTKAAFEEWMAPKAKAYKEEVAEKGANPFYTIPIIFHLIHDNEAVGTGPNLSQARIIAQWEQLNNDFRKVAGTSGDNSNPVGADTGIDFCLAQVDPNGNALVEPGINRINRNNVGFSAPPYDGGTFGSNDYISGTIKPATQWNPNQYFNVWVMDINDGLLGFAQFPSFTGLGGLNNNSGAANTDGVVLLYSSVGSTTMPFTGGIAPYNEGRTLTHEVGHWLGIRHTWGDGDCGADDYCADTPLSDNANYGCSTGHVSCGSVDMVENYMDYSGDACMNIFTFDQKARMQVVMDPNNGVPRRWQLGNAIVCNTDPIVSFSSATSTTIEGTSECVDVNYQTMEVTLNIAAVPTANVNVTIAVTGTATAGQDYMIGNANVIFPANQGGAQTISIVVTEDAMTETDETIEFTITSVNGGGATADLIDFSHTLTIINDDHAPIAGNVPVTLLTQDFSDVSGWTIVNDGTTTDTWVLSTQTNSLDGTPFALMDSDVAGAGATQDEYLYSPEINASGINNLTLDFDQFFNVYAGSGDYNETAKVDVWNGTNWVNVYNLTEASGTQGAWNAPNHQTIDLSLYANEFLKIRFHYTASYDYWWAVDNVVLTGENNIQIQNLVIPNPYYLDYEFGPDGTIHFYNYLNGHIVLSLQNHSSYDYGCIEVQVNRQGNSATPSWQPDQFITDKTYLIIPENNAPSAGDNYTITLYYTADEINGWATGAGDNIANLMMIKTPDAIADGNNSSFEVVTPTVGTFGTGYTYTATFNSGFSGFALGNVEQVLPAELLDFTAKAKTNTIVTNWITAVEVNTQHFEIQRQTTLDNNWTTIGKITAAGNSNSRINYEFEDKTAKKGQVYYYRLLMQDLDGTIDYSTIRQAILEDNTPHFTLSPNPANDLVTVHADKINTDDLEIVLYNINGQVLQTQTMTNTSMDISLENLPQGVYLVEMKNATTSLVQRLVKN